MERWLESFARVGFVRSPDTAHDLKTPLNVAVLNLELLRMRMRKLTGTEDDPKISEYSHSIEVELRRMARIFDTFFLLSTPPKGEGDPSVVDVAAICREAASAAGVQMDGEANAAAAVRCHESRIRQALKLFFEGAGKILKPGSVRLSVEQSASEFAVTLSGEADGSHPEIAKIFKFYYTDPQGNPDLSLAAARLIVETYGGGMNATEESDKVSLRLWLPPGEE